MSELRPGEATPVDPHPYGEYIEAEKMLRSIGLYVEAWEDGDNAYHALGHIECLVKRLRSEADPTDEVRELREKIRLMREHIAGQGRYNDKLRAELAGLRTAEDPIADSMRALQELAKRDWKRRERDQKTSGSGPQFRSCDHTPAVEPEGAGTTSTPNARPERPSPHDPSLPHVDTAGWCYHCGLPWHLAEPATPTPGKADGDRVAEVLYKTRHEPISAALVAFTALIADVRRETIEACEAAHNAGIPFRAGPSSGPTDKERATGFLDDVFGSERSIEADHASLVMLFEAVRQETIAQCKAAHDAGIPWGSPFTSPTPKEGT